jgi:hypothetical protein
VTPADMTPTKRVLSYLLVIRKRYGLTNPVASSLCCAEPRGIENDTTPNKMGTGYTLRPLPYM